MILLKRLKNNFIDIIAIVSTSLFVIAGSIVSLNRFWQYDVFYYNFGIFDQAIWHVSQFQPPYIEHLLVGGKMIFADHFDISILLLAPLFWIFKNSETLLVVQALFAGAAGFVIYKIGVAVLKDKLAALSIVFCYLFFIGIQNAVITDFHELTVMTLPITLTFLAIVRKQIKLFWIFFILVLGFKEVTFSLGIAISIFIYFYNKKWKNHAIAAAIISILWGLLTIKVFIPYFSQGIYLHEPSLPNGLFNIISSLFDLPSKRETVFFSFLNFGFLPLLAPIMWPAILQDYIMRFVPLSQETRYSLGFHYNAPVSTLLAIGSIFGFSFIQKFKFILKLRYLIFIFLFLNSFMQFRFLQNGPFLLSINRAFYKHTSNFAFLNNLVDKIPKNASIMTQNNIGPHFSHQKFIYLRYNYEQYSPEYILLDNREGQNPNNFLWAPNIPELISKIQNDSNYVTLYSNNNQYIFSKITKN